jgi:hypothetical protein
MTRGFVSANAKNLSRLERLTATRSRCRLRGALDARHVCSPEFSMRMHSAQVESLFRKRNVNSLPICRRWHLKKCPAAFAKDCAGAVAFVWL